jgi:hypothetical protein
MRRGWQTSVRLMVLMRLMKSINERLRCVDNHVMKPIITTSTNLELTFAVPVLHALWVYGISHAYL